MELEVLAINFEQENTVPENRTEVPVLSFEQWDELRLAECNDLLLA